MRVVSGIDGIAFVHFDERDVVRHKLVQAIVTRLRIGVAAAPRPGVAPVA